MAKTGYGGFFLKGLAGGLQTGFNIGQSITEMKWKKEQKAKLEKQQEMIMEGVSAFNKRIEEIYADGTITDEENMQLTTMYLASAYEVKERIDVTYKAIQQGQRDIVDQNFQWFKFYGESLGDLDPSSIPELFESTRSQIKGEKGIGLFTAYDSSLKKQYEAKQKVAPEISVTERKYNWAIENYKADKISFDELSKYMGAYIAPEEKSAKEQEIDLMKQYGATNEEIKNKLLGISVGPETTPAPTSTENIREDILNADTFKEAKRIYDNYVKKYDVSSLGITDLKQEWGDIKKSDLDNLVAVLNEITAGTPEGRNVKGNKKFAFNIDGEETTKTGAEWYNAVYESYIALIKLLEEFDIDISQYKKLKPLSEIKKIKFGGFVGEGVGTGDLIKIYY